MSLLRNLLIAVIFALVSVTVVSAEPIDINTATAAEMAAAMKGVGSKKAAAIIDYRNENGPFQEIEELTKVSGIGVKLLEANKANMKVSPPVETEQ